MSRTRTELAESREALVQLFKGNLEQSPDDSNAAGFPRSGIMRFLLSGSGAAAVTAVAGGVMLARPTLMRSLLRWRAVGAVVRPLLKYLLTSVK